MMAFVMFLLGIHVTMNLLAALYRIIDLWYQIQAHSSHILRRLAWVIALNLLLLWWLTGDAWQYFVAGQSFYVIFHLLSHLVGRGIANVLESRANKKPESH